MPWQALEVGRLASIINNSLKWLAFLIARAVCSVANDASRLVMSLPLYSGTKTHVVMH